MAAPHVTGTVALYVAAHGRDANGDGEVNGADVAFIKSELAGAGLAQMDPCGLSQFDDPDGYPEPIVFANATNVGGDGSCAEPPPAGGDIAVTSVTADPATANPGQAIEVRVTVENDSLVDVTSDIFVALVSDNATPEADDDIPIGNETILGGLTAGQSTELVFPWNTVGANAGDHTLTASHGLTDDNGTNDSKTTVVTLGAAALPTIHVGNLEKSSTRDGGGTWTAWVRITVHYADEGVPDSALVYGTWDNAGNTPTEPDDCNYTDATGMCEVWYGGIPNSDGNIVFRVDSLTLNPSGLVAYDQSANHDPEEDSNGTWIRVFFKNTIDYKK
jgi:hypothetical protein